MNINLDPRTRLLVLLFLGMTVAMEVSLLSEVLVLIAVCFLFISVKKERGAVKLLISFIILMLIDFYLPQNNPFFIGIYTLAHVIRKFMMPFACGYYFIYATEVSELMAVFEKMHIPKALTISLVVMLRYLPSLREDYLNLKAAMKMRGISTGIKAVKHPILSAEYILVPLLSSSSIVADELSQAAYTKGIDIPGKKDRLLSRKLRWADGLMMVYVTFLFAAIKGKII